MYEFLIVPKITILLLSLKNRLEGSFTNVGQNTFLLSSHWIKMEPYVLSTETTYSFINSVSIY